MTGMTTVAAAAHTQVAVLANTYRDSVELMRVAAELERLPEVQRAAVVMGTPANRAILLDAGLLADAADAAGPNDLVIAAAGASGDAVEAALARAKTMLSSQATALIAGDASLPPPRTIAEALSEAGHPAAGVAMISTPGTYATAEAFKALKRGLHVFMFSDNVSLDEEIELKRLATRKGLLLMGPDCGTAVIDGIPLGFANVVRRGPIGLVGASGTGLQQVMCLIDGLGEGVSQAIGVGGRDLDERVGGAMMLHALELLAADDETRVIVLLSKPPAASVAEKVLERARACGKPVVVNFLGARDRAQHQDTIWNVPTLEDAALYAAALAHGDPAPRQPSLAPELIEFATLMRRQLQAGQRRIAGLYSGGTLCKEAIHLLGHDDHHDLVDLGDDEFTVGRPHPMIDPRLRNERIVQAGADPATAVVLFDVVLGYGSHADPGGALVPALHEAVDRAKHNDRGLALVASVCGTAGDPQGLQRQTTLLREAGVLVAPSNAQAARLAALIVGEGS